MNECSILSGLVPELGQDDCWLLVFKSGLVGGNMQNMIIFSQPGQSQGISGEKSAKALSQCL